MRWSEESDPSLMLAKQMWEIFRNSKKYTKEFVSVILGSGDDKVDQSLLIKYDLQPCVKNFSDQDFLKAQEFLRNQVL